MIEKDGFVFVKLVVILRYYVGLFLVLLGFYEIYFKEVNIFVWLFFIMKNR